MPHWNSALSTAGFSLKRISATDIVAGLLILALGSGLMPVFSDPGTGWHLRTGRLILETGSIPIHDLFLSPPAGLPWINDQWLGDVVFGLVELIFGLNGVFIFIIGVCSLSYFVLLRKLIEKRTHSLSIATIVFLMASLSASVQFICRPLVFSMLLLVVLHFILLRDLHSERLSRVLYLLVLPLLFLVWANLHGAFTLGLFLLGLFFFHRVVDAYPRRIEMWETLVLGAMSGLLSAVATLINPWGIGLWRSVLGLASSRYFMNLNTEWLPLDVYSPVFTAPLILILLLLFTPRPAGCYRRHCYEFIATVVFIALSLIHRRYMVFLPIVLAPLLTSLASAGLTTFQINRVGPLAKLIKADFAISSRFFKPEGGMIITIVAFVVMSAAVACGYQERLRGFTASYPKKIVDHLRATGAKGGDAIFATPDLGGYIIYQLWPDYRVYIDDRNQLIGEERYRKYFDVIGMRSGWRDTLASTDAEFAILGEESPLAKFLLREDRGWRKEFQDEGSRNILFRKID